MGIGKVFLILDFDVREILFSSKSVSILVVCRFVLSLLHDPFVREVILEFEIFPFLFSMRLVMGS